MTLSAKPPILAILSDLVQVVVDEGDNWPTAHRLAEYAEVDAQSIHRHMFVDHPEVFGEYTRGRMTHEAYRARIVAELGLRCTDAQFDAAFSEVFEPIAPIVALWRRLRAERIRLVAASNIEAHRYARLRTMGIHDLFDAHCLSFEIGWSKPAPEFFKRAVALARVPASTALLVDDRPANVEAAIQAGMHAILYDKGDHAAFVRDLEMHALIPSP
ncbi:MAG: HAD-IA family hydrolase [Patescibacteria group bacterium]|nr:MAG: HAD-IA family hydrolase [Patescibacteria group bacterium]